MRKLLPLAIAGALFSFNAVAADVGVDVNVAGVPVQKTVGVVDTSGATNAASKASAKGQAGLDKAAEKKGKAFGKVDNKLQAGKEQAAALDGMTGLNTSAHLDKVEGKKAEAEAKVDAAHQHAADAKAKGDAATAQANDAVNNAPAAANSKLQGKLNKFGLGN